MEDRLKRLNDELSTVLHELKTEYSGELQAAQSLPQNAKDLLAPLPELEKSIELVNKLRFTLDSPLYTVVDGIFAFSVSKALQTVVHYKIPDILEDHGQLSSSAIANLTTPHLSATSLWQLLSLLSNTAGIFRYNPEDDTFANNASSSLLSTKHWTRWHLWAELYPAAFYDIFAHLETATMETEARTLIQIAYGAKASEPLYGLLAGLPWARTFQETIGAAATAMAPGMLADYPWDEIGTGPVCDLGGGNGELLFTLLTARKELKGAIFELRSSAAVKAAQSNFGMEQEDNLGKFSSVRERVIAIHEGDFFVEVPPYPIYTIRWTLHNWSDDQAVTILNNIRTSIEIARMPESRLLIIEAVVGAGRASRPAIYGSIIMMAGSRGGQERTEKQWRELCARTRWRLHAIQTLRNSIPCIIDLRPE